VTPKFVNVTVQLTGQDGNAMSIIARVRRALLDGGASHEDAKAFTERAMSGDYDNLLRVCMEYVNVR